ncbi:lysozyme inhibitor LprI family protein [Acinetobacter baumannii]|uniref:lysozyme inhibitor LprI family protein n=1 Tax=Acinetobacter baumannii TaxID=470 RepID=UPI000810D7CF|nr:lysozyme inhibitor LprI family protein [Acinetobacter baumannii]
MKKILLISSSLLLSINAFADCSRSKTAFEAQKCLSQEVKLLKTQLNAAYKKAYETTSAKEELESAQKQWLIFKEKQCGDFVVADTQGSPATVEYDLTCQSILYKQRIAFLKELF